MNPVPDDLCDRVPRVVIRPPLESEVVRVMESDDISPNNSVRNRAIMELLYLSGIRRFEVSRLNLLDLRGDELLVHGKGSKERMVPLGWVRTLNVFNERSFHEAIPAHNFEHRPVCPSLSRRLFAITDQPVGFATLMDRIVGLICSGASGKH